LDLKKRDLLTEKENAFKTWAEYAITLGVYELHSAWTALKSVYKLRSQLNEAKNIDEIKDILATHMMFFLHSRYMTSSPMDSKIINLKKYLGVSIEKKPPTIKKPKPEVGMGIFTKFQKTDIKA